MNFGAVLFLAISTSAGKVNRHLIISSTLNPLAAIPNGTVYSEGLIEKELVDLLSQLLNFTYEVRPPRDLLGLGQIVNGTATGVLGQLIRREVDIYTTGTERSANKERYVDASYFFVCDVIHIMMPYPEAHRKTDALYAIYTTEVWVCIAILLIAAAAALQLLFHLEPRNQIETESAIMLLTGLFTNQGVYFKYRRASSVLIWGVWCLAAVVLANIYTGNLISMMTSPVYRPLAETVEDVANNEDIVPFVVRHSNVDEYIRNSPTRALQTIAKRIDANPEASRITNPSDESLLLAGGPTSVFISSEVAINGIIAQDAKKCGRYRFTLAQKYIHARHLSFLFPKNSPLVDIFNKQILLLHEMGLLDRLYRKYAPKVGPCLISKRQLHDKPTNLKLSVFFELFLSLVTGLALSSCALIVSIVIAKRARAEVATAAPLPEEPTTNDEIMPVDPIDSEPSGNETDSLKQIEEPISETTAAVDEENKSEEVDDAVQVLKIDDIEQVSNPVAS